MQEKPKPGRPRSQKARKAILGAVRETLLSDGYVGLRMESVAARAGVSKATIYRWWPTRGALALEAAEPDISIGTVPESVDALADMLGATADSVEDTKPVLIQLNSFMGEELPSTLESSYALAPNEAHRPKAPTLGWPPPNEVPN